jgi:hypothetical protein
MHPLLPGEAFSPMQVRQCCSVYNRGAVGR